MTEYEKLVSEGLPPCNSLDWLLIGYTVQDIIDNGIANEDEKEFIPPLFPEIEYYFRDEPDTIKKLKEIINNGG